MTFKKDHQRVNRMHTDLENQYNRINSMIPTNSVETFKKVISDVLQETIGLKYIIAKKTDKATTSYSQPFPVLH